MWQDLSILLVRNLIGDPVSVAYSDERILELFLASSVLVMFDNKFEEDYVVNIGALSISPDPSLDLDFLALVALRSACVLLNSELRSKGAKKITMKDGPSEITVDNSDLMANLKASASAACKKYEDSIFSFAAGNSVGVAIMGPYSPGSDYVGYINNEDRSFR
jgi:hypothetical protein